MARLELFNGRYCESQFESAFIGMMEGAGWQYLPGTSISRPSRRDVLYEDDMEQFLRSTNPDLTADEITEIINRVKLAGSGSDFATLHMVYGWMVDGIQFTPKSGIARMVKLIHFDDPEKNVFRVVNQFTVEYINYGLTENRRPDVLLYVNGLPLCVIELKNPADANATVYDAWEQINIRYWRDIPHLLHYCPLACISDGVKTRLGTVRTPYEHFYAWRRVNDGDELSTLPFDELDTMIRGVYAPARFLEIFRDYIYFQDSEYDSDEVEIVCRYPQYFASCLLKQSIIRSVQSGSGKGGTYFGATGCGKTYTMAFLARQLALRCTDIPEIGSPTIVMIVDRDDLQSQGAKLFTKSKEFLNLGEVSIVKNRNKLREELGARVSGGFYICTIQKFCDRDDDPIGLINERRNIICFSDEAHRTQLERSKKIQFSKDADENMKAMVSKPYAKVLREAFPHATFVGFTGTPIAETYQTFGEEIDRYTMDQAVADGLTVPIKYHPRIAKVLLDKEKVKRIEEYYKQCAEDGSTEDDIEASKKAMSSMEVILGEPLRLERLAVDMVALIHNPEVDQKRKQELRQEILFFSSIADIEASYIQWRRLSFHRNNRTYEMLMNICQMVWASLLPSVDQGDKKFSLFDEESMPRLYEKFILEYYRQHYSNLHARDKTVEWDIPEDVDPGMIRLLPGMHTDITLRHGGKTLIIDAKYYQKSLSSYMGKQMLHSANIYQIYTYVKNEDKRHTGNVSGMLLYAKTTEESAPQLSVPIGGNQINVRSLDLNRSFLEISATLDQIVRDCFGDTLRKTA